MFIYRCICIYLFMDGALIRKIDSLSLDEQSAAPLLDRGCKVFPNFLRVLLKECVVAFEPYVSGYALRSNIISSVLEGGRCRPGSLESDP